MSLIEALNIYSKHLKFEKNLSLNTISNYKRDLFQFLDYLSKNKIKTMDGINISSIRSFFKFLDNFNYRSRTLARKFSSVKNFLKYFEKEDVLKKQLTHIMIGPKIKKELYNYLTQKEAKNLLNNLLTGDFLSIRNKTIMEFFYSTGARISEVQQISLKELDLKNREVLIVGKGRKERTIYLSDSAVHAIKLYLKARKEYLEDDIKKVDTGYLFINRFGNHLSVRGMREIVKKCINNSGIEKNIKPHDIRHSFATHLLQRGAGIREIQELLGHENISSTQIYTHLDIKKLRDDYKKSHPRDDI